MKAEDWQRAGFVENKGRLERIENATDVRTRAKATGRTDILADDSGPVAVVERTVRDGAVAEVPVQGRSSGRFLVRVVSIRKHLLDEDNLCAKFHVDCCRYAGILPKDSPGTAKIEVCQQKADKGAAEEIKIEVYRL
jgi:hypothetical protein